MICDVDQGLESVLRLLLSVLLAMHGANRHDPATTSGDHSIKNASSVRWIVVSRDKRFSPEGTWHQSLREFAWICVTQRIFFSGLNDPLSTRG